MVGRRPCGPKAPEARHVYSTSATSNEIKPQRGGISPDRPPANQDLLLLAFHAAPLELGLVFPFCFYKHGAPPELLFEVSQDRLEICAKRTRPRRVRALPALTRRSASATSKDARRCHQDKPSAIDKPALRGSVQNHFV